MLKKINRAFQDYMREKRLKIGKYIWDRKNKNLVLTGNNFIENNNINSIIFMRYDGKIGDMVVNTLMFREIKKKYPYIKIGVITKGAAKDIIKNNPNVDKIYDYEKKYIKVKRLAKTIAEEKYDLLIDFSEMLRVNQMMLINLCKARINMGLDRKKWNLFDISIDSNIDFTWKEHITKRYRAYLIKLGFEKEKINLNYDIFYEDKNKYNTFFEKLKSKKILVLNPYGASKHKSFNLITLDKIIKHLNKIEIEVVLIYFSDKWRELEKLKESNNNVHIPSDINTINDSSIIIDKSNYVITPDTSIVHIASALNKKLIAVYPPNGGKYGVDHLVWGPLLKNSQVIFCKDKDKRYDEIDINTFNFKELETCICNLLREDKII